MQADYVLEYDVLSLEQERHLYLLARVRAAASPAGQRRPLNLCLVLDRSGSMQGAKLDYVRQAAQFLVQRLGAADRLSLVTYSETVHVNLGPGPVLHKDAVNQALQAIRAGGTTNLSGGWLQGCSLVAEGLAEGQVNRVLLLTDGLANVGVTDPDRLAAMARQKRQEGIVTTTMGVGLDFNEDLLTRMAAEGGGAFYFIDNPDQAPHIFAEELADLLSVVGQNLLITLTLSPQVHMVRQLNAYPAEVRGREVVFRLGDLFADELKTLVLELSIPALERLGQVEVGQLRFDYDELGQQQVAHRTLTLPIVVNLVGQEAFAGQAPNAEVVRAALLLRAARAREEAIRYADDGDFQHASQVLAEVADAIQSAPLEDEVLQAEHDMLREEALDMELGASRYDSHARKAATTKSFYAARQARMQETVALHTRLKASRPALERHGPPPAALAWRRERLPLHGRDRVRIGRAADNDVVVPEDGVSAYHCQIVRGGADLFLEDLNSTNGTYANGGRVAGRFRLSVGDIITVGSWLFMCRDAAP